jgi:hypothetical protein
MGGMGSGPYRRHNSTSRYLHLDVNKLHRGGWLEPGRACSWQWTWGYYDDKSTISIAALAGSLRLTFRVKDNGGKDWQSVEQYVEIERTPCNYGGTRPWFLCPRCGRRVSVLYGAKAFYCRACHCIAYQSQSETYEDRCFRRANKLRQRMGGEPGCEAYIPKPKGMRWATHERVVQEVRELENAGFLATAARFPSLRGMIW